MTPSQRLLAILIGTGVGGVAGGIGGGALGYNLAKDTEVDEALAEHAAKKKTAADDDEKVDPLTDEEERDIERGKSQWFGKIFPTLADSPSVDMASPVKNSLLVGGLGALPGAAYGGMLGAANGNPLPGALIGAAATGLPIGLLNYFGQKTDNEDIEDTMRRHGPGATRREVLGDAGMRGKHLQLASMA